MMQLDLLLQAIGPVRVLGRTDIEVTRLISDSKQAVPGSLFVAIHGQKNDGHQFVSEATARGAVGVIVDRPIQGINPATMIQVLNSRRALALLATKFYGDPSERLRMIGVTGTNGKTTTTYLIRQILKSAGRRVGMLGTISYAIEDEEVTASLTTPDPLTLQSCLAQMNDRGINDVVMEVSSHALELDRVIGCDFEIAVFTNLSRDHLDFHKTMDRYFLAKEKLFLSLREGNKKSESKRAIVNRDDPWGARLVSLKNIPVWSYGMSPPADIWAEKVEMDLQGMRFAIHTPVGSFEVRSPLLGTYNVLNILAAVGVGLQCGIKLEAIQRGILEMRLVPGRFERVDAGQDFSVIVDYAHTEEALDRLLGAAASLSKGKIITVFGCGGDRDQGKRTPMGRVSARLSDWVIITSDNPRSEEPGSIIEQIEAGVKDMIQTGGKAAGYDMIQDRRGAIERAIEMAKPGDVVVVAGKGHENYQLIGHERFSFDDRAVALGSIRKFWSALS